MNDKQFEEYMAALREMHKDLHKELREIKCRLVDNLK